MPYDLSVVGLLPGVRSQRSNGPLRGPLWPLLDGHACFILRPALPPGYAWIDDHIDKWVRSYPSPPQHSDSLPREPAAIYLVSETTCLPLCVWCVCVCISMDLGLSLDPIRVETAEGRREYQQQQLALYHKVRRNGR